MVHVLMPSTDGHQPHIPALVYVDPDGTVNCRKISDMHLELRDITGGLNPSVPPEVFDFGDDLLGSRSVDRTLVEPVESLPDGVHARVRLTAGSHGGTHRLGGFWNFTLRDRSVVPRLLPTAVNWSIPGIRLSHLTIDNKAGRESFEVFPDGNNNIHILIVHVTRQELEVIGPDIPPTPACIPHKHEASHFRVYRSLLKPEDDFIVPEFDEPRTRGAGLCKPRTDETRSGSYNENAESAAKVGDCLDGPQPDHADESEHSDPHAAAAAGSELTCMVTTAPVTPP
jgi:hypothetical protein